MPDGLTVPYWNIVATGDEDEANMKKASQKRKVFSSTTAESSSKGYAVAIPVMTNEKAIPAGTELFLL